MEFENKKLRSVAEAATRIMMGEQLKGGQVKLDKNHNNKIDAQDFKILKGQKKEETMHEESCECGSCPSDKDMKKEEVDLDEADTLLARTGMNLPHKFPRSGQTNLGNIPAMNTPGNSKETDAYAEKRRGDRAKQLKPAIKAALGTHGPKGKLPEEVDLDEGKMGQLDADLKDLSHADFHKEYGKPKHHYDPSNFKKPVQPGKEMDRAKSLAQRGMASMKKEEVEELEEMFPGTPEYEKKYGKAPQDMKKGEKKKTTQGEMEKTEKGVVHKRKFSEMVESYSEGGVKGLFRVLAEEPTSAEFDAQLGDAKKRAAGTKKQPEVSKPAVQAVQNEEYELTLEDFTPEELEEFMQTEEYEQLDELSKDTLYSYVKKSEKDQDDQFKKIGKGIRDSDPKSANKAGHKFSMRSIGQDRAENRLAKEGVESFEEQTHTTVSFIDYNDVNGVKYAEIDLEERHLTDAETDKKEDIVKSMKKGLSGFKERYGKDAKSVMYATATKQAKGE